MKNALTPIALAGTLLLAVAGTSCTGISTGSQSQTSQNTQNVSLTINTASLPSGQVSAPYKLPLAATGGSPPYTWSDISGVLPPGLHLNPISGLISGTPTLSGHFSFQLEVSDSSSPQQSVSKPLSITVSGTNSGPALEITSSSMPAGSTGTSYSTNLTATGGVPPYAWSVIAGQLPDGLSLNSNGTLVGAPALAGEFTFVALVADSGAPQQGATGEFYISISPAQAPALKIGTSSMSAGTTGTSYSDTLVATGGTQPYNWSIVSGTLPSGLSLSGSNGVISGTLSSAGLFGFTVQVADSSSPKQASTQALTISVAASGPPPLTIATASLHGGQTGVSYTSSASASGGTTPYVWSIASGALPAGVVLNSANGTISGTPTSAGQFSFDLQVTDSSTPPQVSTQALSISIVASGPQPVQISPGQDVGAIVGANPAGATFAFSPGIYRLSTPINAKNGDVFLGPCTTPPCAASDQAVLSGAVLLTSFQQSGSYYYVTGQTQQGKVTVTSDQCETGYEGCIYPEDLYFDNVPLTHVTSLADVVPGTWFFDYSTHTIYFYDNPSGHTVETSVTPAAFAQGPANNVTVQGLTIEKFATPAQTGAVGGAGSGFGVPSAGANWIVENNEIRLNHSYAVRINFGWQVLNNYLHDNGNLGVAGGVGGGNADGSGTTASGILIQGNEIAYNNYAHFSTSFQAGGSKIAVSFSVIFRGNYVHDNEGPGLWADLGSSGILYDNNTIANNTTGGIAHEISYGSVVRNNRLLTNAANMPSQQSWLFGANLLSSTSQGLEAYCNTVEVASSGGNAMTILVQQRSTGDNQVSSNNYYHHNTVIFDGNSGIMGGAWAPASEQTFFVNNQFDYNSYYMPDLTRQAFAWNGTYNTFAQFQTAGQDVHGMAAAATGVSFPTVTIDSPSDQTTVSGVVNIVGTASDASSISKVEFYVDWALQSTVSGDSFSFAWDTSGASSGPHTVAAMAYNSEGVRACYGVSLNVQ
jgi:hypothetical protein